MKRVVLVVIPALICGAMLTNCKRAEQKDSLALTSEVVLADRESDESVSRKKDEYEAFVMWVRDSIQRRAYVTVTNNEVVFDRETDKILSPPEKEAYEAFVIWVRDSIQRRENQKLQNLE